MLRGSSGSTNPILKRLKTSNEMSDQAEKFRTPVLTIMKDSRFSLIVSKDDGLLSHQESGHGHLFATLTQCRASWTTESLLSCCSLGTDKHLVVKWFPFADM